MSAEGLKLRDASLLKQKCYIDGQWTGAIEEATFDVIDPATGRVIGTMPEMTAGDTELAIQSAARCLDKLRYMSSHDRSTILHRWYELMIENAEDLARLITAENGKPLAHSRYEVHYAASYFEWYSGEAVRLYGETIPTVPGARSWTIKEPVGVCGLITPWNWPAGMVTRKIGPAIAAGCPVVLRAPSQTPFTSAALLELGHRAGLPRGAANLVTAMHNTSEVGTALTSSAIVKKISFTGSTNVGKTLMAQSAKTLKKLSFELGGNAPFIVFNDAHLHDAVDAALECKYKSTGQICVAANRIFVQRNIYEAFPEAFTAKVRTMKLGSGSAEDTDQGPLINAKAVEKAEKHVQDAKQHGGRIMTGGSSCPEVGANFYSPTVIRDANSSMMIAIEETFGPVAALFMFEDEKDAIQQANDTEVGLAGYFYSQDVAKIFRVAEALEVGMVGVNTIQIAHVATPFGGIKESGFGIEGSKYGIESYLRVKSITLGGIHAN